MRQRYPAACFFVVAVATLAVHCSGVSMAEEFRANYDESQVPPYTLPDPLIGGDGRPVTTVEQWNTSRRPELLRLFETEEYGHAPAERPKLEFTTRAEDRSALGGKAIRKEVTIEVVTPRGRVPLYLLLYIPKAKTPAPVFLGLNFCGNQAVAADPAISLARAWILDQPKFGIVGHRASEASRGCEAGRWQIEEVVGRGYAVATMCCGDIEPDSPDGISRGVRPLFYRPGQTEPDADEWGAIAAWAWGLSRALDYLETEPLVDAQRVAVWGHSRLGKTALWAAACDERFALAISNNSGCGGAALSRRIFGETVGRINAQFPHWFCRNSHKYNERENELPIDQHELIALIAPRPVYVASAAEDLWADPRGEFLAAKHAEPVYELFGLKGLATDEMPPVDHSVGDTIGYHIRTGKHDTTAYDWQQYLAFADRHFGRELGWQFGVTSANGRVMFMDKAVILAAGRGTRMQRAQESADLDASQNQVANSGMKAMMPVGRPFIDYVLSQLADAGCRQVCLVIGPDHATLREHVRRFDGGRLAIHFAVQREAHGTANALAAAAGFVGDDTFTMINSDNYYPLSALCGLRAMAGAAVAAFRPAGLSRGNISAERIRNFAILAAGADGRLERAIEKPSEAYSSRHQAEILVGMNCWRFTPTIFEACRAIPRSPRKEYELTDAVAYAIAELDERFEMLVVDEPVLDLSTRADVIEVTRRLASVEVRL